MIYQPTIIIDDDNADVLENFQLKSARMGVKTILFNNWDQTKEYLESGKPVDAIVLDARGQLTADDSPGEEHLFESFSWVKSKNIPYAIYTGYTDQLAMLKRQKQEGRVFSKGKYKEEDVIDYLKLEIDKQPIIKLRNKYESSFKVFYQEIIDQKYEHNLIELLKCIEEESFKKKNLNTARDVLESVYFALIENFVWVPDSFIKPNRSVNLEWCTRYLEGKDTTDANRVNHSSPYSIPDHIKYQLRFVKEITSSLSHLSAEAEVKYEFLSAAHSILGILDWLPTFINDNFES